MKNLKHEKETTSYMQLCLNLDGKNPLYLMVPTFYDDNKKEWSGFVKTPETKRMIFGVGKNSRELEQNFNKHLSQSFEEIPEEAFSMFKPLEYWESRI